VKETRIVCKSISKMSKALRFVCLSLQRARESFVNPKNKQNNSDEMRNEQLSHVLVHNISVFHEASKLCEKIPVNTGRSIYYVVFCHIISILPPSTLFPDIS
jgi:hypothetical protein